MTFKRAWDKRIEYTDKDSTRDPQVIIIYDNGEASMVIPGYFKNTEKAEDVLNRAWSTLCRVSNKKEDCIEQILVEDARPIAGEKEKKTA